MTRVYTDVEQWIGQRHRWLQDAAARLIKNNNVLTNKDFQELIELCKAEAQIIDSDRRFMTIEPSSLSAKESEVQLRIDAIHNVKGISALGPSNPLSFNGSLSIVYGQNGSGKSSYVRLLKHVSGAKKTGKLIGNVYVQDQQPQECSLTITSNAITKDIKWTPESGPLSELSTIKLYDTNSANIYVNDENEVAYEPWILHFFTQLTNICTRVGEAVKQEMESIILTKLTFPEGSSKTKEFLWFSSINEKTSTKEINTHCSWVEADDFDLANKRKQLVETDPLDKMKQFRNISQNIGKLHVLLTDLKNSLSDETCTMIIKAKSDYENLKKAADEDANKVFEGLPLEGVGTESWRLLWEQAKSFSQQYAYPSRPFPYTSTNSNCVLCHQPLSSEAKDRLDSFESYVKATLSKKAKIAEVHVESLFKAIKEVPKESILELHINSIGVSSDIEKKNILDFCVALQKRSDLLEKAISLDQLPPLPAEDVLVALSEAAAANEQQASDYDKLSKMESRDELKDAIIELESRKWLHQNKAVILDNVDKLKRKAKFKTALSLANTKGLSTKKSSLSDELITAEYIKRFQGELKKLGGSRINVELVKSKAERGHVYHQIRLRNCPSNIRTSEVLSEGEFRIVSLAGFLADVESGSDNTPFIFDDPISSLDQSFEEATVTRIAELSLKRQVIVFTHRLSFLTLLEEAANKLGIECKATWLRSESWGVGEPGGVPIYAKKPDKALNLLLNERVNRARKVLNEHGRIEYELLAKGICSDFRILIERFIETELLSDVVQRFRRSVNTLNKIHKLAHITADDCKMFEDFMTKYSTFEHSQSYETPVMLPEPDELTTDMERMLNWLEEFKKRTKA